STALSTGAPETPFASVASGPATPKLVKRERHVARLGPPFAATNGSRRIGDERLAEVRVTER
ncbi:MAG TPA: hypothetical protein VGQ57_05855, partial [Polyangiaceae bacterium]|nr:hypothetical protein [Polyangiaceae bacterium]